MAMCMSNRASERRGVRRLNPLRDLGQVVNVIAEGFGDDLTPEGQRALKEMRLLSRLRPLLWWLAVTSPDFHEYHSGFVWVEEGQIVGTMHITRPNSHARRWLISNVAVQSEYRGRGIARSLMERALDWAREQGGKAVFLRARRDNAAAWSLYQHLGFQPLYDSVELRLDRVPTVRRVSSDNAILVPYRSQQWLQVRNMARAIIPSQARWLEPIRVSDFHPTLERRLSEWWAGLTKGFKVHRLVARRDEQIIAALAVKIATRRGAHSLLIRVRPDCRGQVEEMLVTEALRRLEAHPNKRTLINLPVNYAEIMDVLQRYGFKEQKTLALMRRSLHQRDQ